MTGADFLTHLLANVGNPDAFDATTDDLGDEPAAPAVETTEVVHLNGFTTTDEITAGGIVYLHRSWFPVVRVNRATVVVEVNGNAERIPVRQIIAFRPAA